MTTDQGRRTATLCAGEAHGHSHVRPESERPLVLADLALWDHPVGDTLPLCESCTGFLERMLAADYVDVARGQVIVWADTEMRRRAREAREVGAAVEAWLCEGVPV